MPIFRTRKEVPMRKALRVGATIAAFALTAWIGVVALAQSSPTQAPTTSTTVGDGDQFKGPCDEAEHANEPECVGATLVAEDNEDNETDDDADDQGENENADDQGDDNDDQGENEQGDDNGVHLNDDQGENEDNDDQGENDEQGDNDDQGEDDNSGPSDNSGPGGDQGEND
jgi:hypothetical protein